MARNLQNWLTAYLEFTAETESPACYHFWTGATILSAATRGRVSLDMKMFRVFPNIFTILVGPSGARKSAATSIGIKIAREVGIKKFSDKITGAALIRDLSKNQEQLAIPLDVKKGIEGGVEVKFNAPMMIYASELGVFLGQDAYGSGVITDLTDLYDNPLPDWKKTTISRGDEFVPAPFVTLLAASTPQTLKDVLPAESVGQGFTSRIFFVWGDGRRKRVPFPIWDEGIAMLQKNLIADLKNIMQLTGEFQFTPGARDRYTEVYMKSKEPHEEYQDERLQGYASRKATHLLKLSMICSLAKRSDLIIDEDAWSYAEDALKWVDQGISYVFAGHGAASNSQDVVRVFKQIQHAEAAVGFISYPELLKRNYNFLNLQEFDSVMNTLVGMSAITEAIARDPRNGSVCKMYKVQDANFIERWNGALVPRNIGK
jgi:hypothetical protein